MISLVTHQRYGAFFWLFNQQNMHSDRFRRPMLQCAPLRRGCGSMSYPPTCVICTVTPPVVQPLTSACGYGEDFRRHYASIHKQHASTIASTTSHTILLPVGSCSHTRPVHIHEQAVKARKSSNVCCLSCHDSFYSDGYTTLIITFAVHTNSRRNHRR